MYRISIAVLFLLWQRIKCYNNVVILLGKIELGLQKKKS